MPPGRSNDATVGAVAGERWLAVQADRAATQTAAAATALIARMSIRRTVTRPGCADVTRNGGYWSGWLVLRVDAVLAEQGAQPLCLVGELLDSLGQNRERRVLGGPLFPAHG